MQIAYLDISGEGFSVQKNKGIIAHFVFLLLLIPAAAFCDSLEEGLYAFERKDYANAQKMLLPLADSGNSYAQSTIGQMCEDENGALKNTGEAIKWYTRAAELGDDLAQYRLGVLLAKGQGGRHDYAEAMKWFNKVAMRNDSQYRSAACACLGYLYDLGYGEPQNHDEAMKWYKKADFDERYDFITRLGIGFHIVYASFIFDSTKDKYKLFNLYLKLSEQGDNDTKLILAVLYQYCEEFSNYDDDKNLSESLKILRNLAESGHAEAQYIIGMFFLYGNNFFASDHYTALHWLNKSAEQGYIPAQVNLGSTYKNGERIGKRLLKSDQAKAVYWYQKAALQGSAQGQLSLGWIYDQGRGVPQNDREAFKWYLMAGEQGMVSAQSRLFQMYLTGRGVPQDYAEAAKWCRKAAENGNRLCQFELGQLYEEGLGVKQDYCEAMKWYRQASEYGDVNAQLNLARIHSTQGLCAKSSLIDAYKWLTIALSTLPGDQRRNEARNMRDILFDQMTTAQVTEAQNQARGWVPIPLARMKDKKIPKFGD